MQRRKFIPLLGSGAAFALLAAVIPVDSLSLERLVAAFSRFFPDLGGLLSYGNEQRDSFRLAATYIDRVLKGEKPSELPVQAPVKFELVINMKTAKALGLDVPSHLQQRADTIIIEWRCRFPLLALFGHRAMSDLSPHCASRRTSGSLRPFDPPPAESLNLCA